jgi:hypothetical protein
MDSIVSLIEPTYLVKNIPYEVVKQNAIALAKTAKILNIPVVITSSQEANIQGSLLPELKEIRNYSGWGIGD